MNDDLRSVFRSAPLSEASLRTRLAQLGLDRATPWKLAALENSWVNYGTIYPDAQYRRLPDGRVQLRGTIKSGTVNSAALTLPAGFRPPAALMFPTATDVNTAGMRITVYPDGSVTPISTGTAYVSLDAVSFLPA